MFACVCRRVYKYISYGFGIWKMHAFDLCLQGNKTILWHSNKKKTHTSNITFYCIAKACPTVHKCQMFFRNFSDGMCMCGCLHWISCALRHNGIADDAVHRTGNICGQQRQRQPSNSNTRKQMVCSWLWQHRQKLNQYHIQNTCTYLYFTILPYWF